MLERIRYPCPLTVYHLEHHAATSIRYIYFLKVKYTPSQSKLCQYVFHKARCQELDPSDALIKASSTCWLVNMNTHIQLLCLLPPSWTIPVTRVSNGKLPLVDLISTKDSRSPSICHRCGINHNQLPVFMGVGWGNLTTTLPFPPMHPSQLKICSFSCLM